VLGDIYKRQASAPSETALERNATALRDEVKALGEALSSATKSAEEAVAFLSKAVSDGAEAARAGLGAVSNAKEVLVAVRGDVQAATGQLAATVAEEKARRAAIADENAKLDLRKRDLDIYADRVRGIYKERGLREPRLT